MCNVKRAALMTAFAAMVAVAPTESTADEKVEGNVVRTNLTLCQPRPTGGGCEGTLTLEAKAAGTAQQITIKVTTDTIIRKGQDYTFLPATQGSSVGVVYVTEKGEKVAKSIEVIGAAR